MSGALLGVVGLAALFALTAILPLTRGSCHGSCEDEGRGEACATCPFGVSDDRGAREDESPLTHDDPFASNGRS